MERHKRFAWAWAAAGLLTVTGLLGACDPSEEPDSGTDAGTQVPDSGTQTDAGTGTDAGTRTDAGTGTDAGTDAGTGSGTDAGTTVTLPLAVDGTWIPSGYMGAPGETANIKDEPLCPEPRPAGGRGTCHRFTWSPGSGQGWAGVYWQYPENNWGSMDGFRLPAGARAVSFLAWGASGGEVVDFFVGIADATADGFQQKLAAVALTATPKQYTIQVSRADQSLVVGGFGWAAGAGDKTTPVVFYVDDIHWH